MLIKFSYKIFIWEKLLKSNFFKQSMYNIVEQRLYELKVLEVYDVIITAT